VKLASGKRSALNDEHASLELEIRFTLEEGTAYISSKNLEKVAFCHDGNA
jgi:hypothetical protein